MHFDSSLSRTLAAVAATALLALATGASAQEGEPEAERKAWDQEKMTALTGQLAGQVREIRRAFRREPGFRDPSNPNRRAMNNMEQILRQLEQSTGQLSNRVQGGAGFDDTVSIARRIGMLLNDAEVEGRRIMTSQWLDEKIQPAMKTINEIAPYYGAGPLYDPDTMQRIDR